MKRKILLSLLVLTMVITITGCGKTDSKKDNSTEKKVEEKEEKLIKLTAKDKEYFTTFKTVDDKFVQTNPKYNQVDSEELGVFITFQYIESTKEAYDYAKTHNFLGNKYAEGEVKEYKWNNYDGYSYGIAENELYFRILLEDSKDNCIVLSAFVGPKNKKVDFSKLLDSEDFKKFLNSIEFKKDSK